MVTAEIFRSIDSNISSVFTKDFVEANITCPHVDSKSHLKKVECTFHFKIKSSQLIIHYGLVFRWYSRKTERI